MEKEYFIDVSGDEEIIGYINEAKSDHVASVLRKHMMEALEQLRTSCSEEECKEWEELIRKTEELQRRSKDGE